MKKGKFRHIVFTRCGDSGGAEGLPVRPDGTDTARLRPYHVQSTTQPHLLVHLWEVWGELGVGWGGEGSWETH